MKTAIFVDGANFFYMQKERLHWWVDPKKFLRWCQEKFGEVTDAIYYVGVNPNSKNKDNENSYLKALTYMGYSLNTKDVKVIIDQEGRERNKANLDIEIVVDMFNMIENYDCAVLVSGDSDFANALDKLRGRGKRFHVVSTKGFGSTEIREVAGMHFTDLDEIRDQVEKD